MALDLSRYPQALEISSMIVRGVMSRNPSCSFLVATDRPLQLRVAHEQDVILSLACSAG